MLTLISTKFKFKKIIDFSGIIVYLVHFIGTITIIEQLTFYKLKSFQTEQHKALKDKNTLCWSKLQRRRLKKHVNNHFVTGRRGCRGSIMCF